jgi:hypothetical protein
LQAASNQLGDSFAKGKITASGVAPHGFQNVIIERECSPHAKMMTRINHDVNDLT